MRIAELGGNAAVPSGDPGKLATAVRLRQQQRLEAIGTLAGGVAHEINNPINGIANYAQLVSDRLPSGSPLRDYLAEIQAETERVASIVRSLLAFARDERQHYSPARIVDIVDGTLTLIRTVMRRDQITLDVTIPDGLPIVCCRSQQIQQVLMNLVTNARDALNERYPGYDARKIIRVTAGASEREDGAWVRLTVEDRGNGIPPDIRARIFEPFFTTKPQGKGTGLGLSISHGIVKDHNGDLHVETELGQYTRFHVDLPAEPLPSASATTAEAPLRAPAASAKQGGVVDAVAVPGPKARG